VQPNGRFAIVNNIEGRGFFAVYDVDC